MFSIKTHNNYFISRFAVAKCNYCSREGATDEITALRSTSLSEFQAQHQTFSSVQNVKTVTWLQKPSQTITMEVEYLLG